MHIFRHLFVSFQTSVYTFGEFRKNRNNSTVFEELQISVLLAPLCVASKTAFATIKSTIDTSNSSNTVLLYLKCTFFFKLTKYFGNLNIISAHKGTQFHFVVMPTITMENQIMKLGDNCIVY